MAKVVFGLGFITGFAMFAVALLGPPAASGVTAREGAPEAGTPSTGCGVQEFALDEGYGVSRKVVTRNCAAAE
jgi:hypothetical protein